MAEQPPSASTSTQKQDKTPNYGREVLVSYKRDTRTRLRSSLRSIARFLRIMSPLHEPLEEFGCIKEGVGYERVDGYSTYLAKLYQSAATHTIDKDRWKITKITIYKSREKVQHEYLIADAVCAQDRVFLRIERRVHMSGVAQVFKNASSSSAAVKGSSSDDSDSPPDNAVHQTPAHSLSKIASDEISFAKTLANVLPLGEKMCEVIEFPQGEEMWLPQLAVLASCVNNMGRNYDVFAENCYWFTHLMKEAVKKIKPNCKEVKFSKKKQGSWNGIVFTTKSTPAVIDQAKTSYDTAWAAFLKDIHDTINNPNNELYKEAEQKRKEAQQQLEESERRREEEREEAQRIIAEKDEELKKLKALFATQNTNSS